MPYLQLEDRQFPLLEGETRVGRGESADVQLPDDEGAEGVHVVITVADDLSATASRGPVEAPVAVNGITLGTQPSPLFHGDRLAINGLELFYGDEAQGGLTAKVLAVGATAQPQELSTTARGVAGGRLVSLIDGREYTIRTDGLTVGRDAGCDVVIAASEVSRRHARIELRPDGYAIIDKSTNGILVNGIRVEGARPLSRGDTIQIGPEEFRFHAEAAQSKPAPPPPVILATPPVPVRSRPAPSDATTSPSIVAAASASRAHSPPPKPATPEPVPPTRPPRPQLATLEIINEGAAKGTRFSIDSPLTHIGRGAHNDVVLADESVSDSHAKIQRREAGWFVVDMGSTNGTYVDGKRIGRDTPLSEGNDLRFGGVKLSFRPTASPEGEIGGTRVIVGFRSGTPLSSDVVPEEVDALGPSTAPDEPGLPRLLLGGLLLLALIVIYLIFQTF